MTEWSGIRQNPVIREWSSNPKADEAFARWREVRDSASPEAHALAQRFHETYERLAPQFNYETQPATSVSWVSLPLENKALMVAVAAEILDALGEQTRP